MSSRPWRKVLPPRCAPQHERHARCEMTTQQALGTRSAKNESKGRDLGAHGLVCAEIMIANAPDPVFVSDLEGKILQANDAVSQLLGFRQDELIEQSLSRFISTSEERRVGTECRSRCAPEH